MRKTAPLLLSALLVFALHAEARKSKDTTGATTQRLTDAVESMEEIMATPDRSIPQDLLNKAECAVVIPGMKSGALIIGAKYGRGFVLCRQEDGKGWGAPSAVRLEGGSIGFQAGGSETDVVMLVMNRRGARRLVENSKFAIGGEAQAAAGPVGRTSTAETDASMRAEILTWSRARGVFAGISLKGNTLRPDFDANEDLYGQAKLPSSQIVFGGKPVPDAAQRLVGFFNKYSARKSE